MSGGNEKLEENDAYYLCSLQCKPRDPTSVALSKGQPDFPGNKSKSLSHGPSTTIRPARRALIKY